MKIHEINIGDTVCTKDKFPMQVVGIFLNEDIYLNFKGNEGDIWEEKAENLTLIKKVKAKKQPK